METHPIEAQLAIKATIRKHKLKVVGAKVAQLQRHNIMVKMNFPTIWIAWIKSCISTPSYSLLINGHPSKSIKVSKGVWQGDPLSSYLFILVSQNLTALLNYALKLGIIPGFNPDLHHNLSHLMYTDDLVLITKSFRSVARNINFSLSIYPKLTGQKPNQNKSAVFLLSWLNKNLV